MSSGTELTPVDDPIVATTYFGRDQVGTIQMELSGSGAPVWRGEFTPFGQEIDNQITNNLFKFTNKERDTESGLDYFGARYYASSMGRFMSPDSSGSPEPVPYADYEDPQSLNLYAYAGNNPIRRIDNEGHYYCDPDRSSTSTDSAGNTTITVTAGACHYDWGDFTNYVGQIARKTTSALSNATQQVSNTLSQVDWQRVGCIGNRALAGGLAGAGAGAVAGALTGPGEVVTVPGGALIGSLGFGAGSGAVGAATCKSGGGGGGGRASGSEARLTRSQQRQTAEHLGMREVKGVTSQGQPVFEKDGRYFSFSNTSHSTGPNGELEVFKELDRNGNRIGTTDLNFNRIGP